MPLLLLLILDVIETLTVIEIETTTLGVIEIETMTVDEIETMTVDEIEIMTVDEIEIETMTVDETMFLEILLETGKMAHQLELAWPISLKLFHRLLRLLLLIL